MRDLTEEELALAPEWATHYLVDSVDDDIIYESVDYCWWKSLPSRMSNFTFDESRSELINRKPFDITQHEWSDKMANLGAIMSERGDVVIRIGSSWIFLDKPDGIAIAKALGVTAEDLK